MHKPKVIWQEIPESEGMRGCRATLGDRSVEVVQRDEGSWYLFRKLDGHTCKRMPGEPHTDTYNSAKARATRFLLKEETPNVWPQACCGA